MANQRKPTIAARNRTARALRWLVAPAALVVLVGWVAARAPAAPPEESDRPGSAPAVDGEAQGDRRAPAPAARAAAPHAPAPATAPATLAQVQRVVEEKNRESQKDQKAFAAAGWTLVDVPPPDRRLLALDPALLGGAEGELRTQIASTTPSPDQLQNLAEIARRASEDQTRVAAVEALGRGGPEGQPQLLSLLDQLPAGDRARREVVPLLRPQGLDSPLAAELARRLDSGGLDATERRQVAFTLALLGLRDQARLPDSVLSNLSGDARALLDSMTRLARQASSENQENNP